MHPGDTIKPEDRPDEPKAEVTSPPPSKPELEKVPAVIKQEPAASPAVRPEQANSWQYTQEAADYYAPPAGASIDPITWTASEFLENEKNNSWFVGLGGITGLAAVVIYFMTHDVVAIVAVILAAALFGVTAKRKPRTLQYQLSSVGVNIGGKLYEYAAFKSFSVVDEGAFGSIQLMPLKRFMPPISLYYPPEHEDQIITMLGNYLPHEDRKGDPIDSLMRKVRF